MALCTSVVLCAFNLSFGDGFRREISFYSPEELLCGNLDNAMSYSIIPNTCCIADAFINHSRPNPGRREKI